MPDRLENDFPTSPVSNSAWNRRALESLTMYRGLSTVRIPQEFVTVRLIFERKWTFDGGFVSRLRSIFDSQLIFHSIYSS